MVESDGIGKSTSGEPGAGEAAQALRAILQTHYLRYMIIGTWALGLLATVGFTSAALWFVATVAAGTLRGPSRSGSVTGSAPAGVWFSRLWPPRPPPPGPPRLSSPGIPAIRSAPRLPQFC